MSMVLYIWHLSEPISQSPFYHLPAPRQIFFYFDVGINLL